MTAVSAVDAAGGSLEETGTAAYGTAYTRAELAKTLDGFTLDELNNASNDFSPADSMPIGRGSVAAGEVSSPNADALAFLNEMTSV